jgi:predicted AlkP superfamily phosphohydrolase/phosphomutase
MSNTVLIGLDGATFTILDPLMEDGHMPFLKDFIDRGYQAKLLSTPNPLTPPAWISMITGRSPAHHGVYEFVRWEERKGDFYFTLYNSSDILCETIWSMASRYGLKVTHLNFPMMAPPKPINGSAIPSMVQWRHIRKSVYPKTLPETLKSMPGFNPEHFRLTFQEANEAIGIREQTLSPKDQVAWVSRITRREYQWFNILRHLMQNEPSNLTAIVLDGVDKLQHLCWRFLDAPHMPTKWEDWEQRMRDHTLEYFRTVDGYVRDIVNLAGEDANVFIVSDHGFGPTRYVFHVNVLLEKLGYLAWKNEQDDDVKRISHEWSFASVDWTKTSAYVGTPASNGIFIRAPGEPGENRIGAEEYFAVRERLKRQLLEFRDPATGEQIIKEILTREEAFPGPCMEKAPDLLLTLSDHSFVSIADEEPIVFKTPNINGTHRPEGVFVAGGPMIQSGKLEGRYSILDVAPTLLYSLGLPVPHEFEGKLAAESIRPEHLKSHPVIVGEGGEAVDILASTEQTESFYTEDEEKQILAQLRGLGYLE